MNNCLFLESGLLVDNNINKTLFSEWLSKGEKAEPQVLSYIDQCEALGNETFVKF